MKTLPLPHPDPTNAGAVGLALPFSYSHLLLSPILARLLLPSGVPNTSLSLASGDPLGVPELSLLLANIVSGEALANGDPEYGEPPARLPI